MTELYFILLTACILGYAVANLREDAKPKPIDPDLVRTVVKKSHPLYHKLPHKLQKRLLARTEKFLQTKIFKPAGDLEEVSDKARICIASEAATLLLGRHVRRFRTVQSIVVYPGATVTPGAEGHALLTRLGGSVFIALQAARDGTQNYNDGHNVVLHEFAHHLDFEGPFAGVPAVWNPIILHRWLVALRKIRKELKSLRVTTLLRTLRSRKSCERNVEIFPHAVEHFFERPSTLAAEHPELYALLTSYFGLDMRSYHRR